MSAYTKEEQTRRPRQRREDGGFSDATVQLIWARDRARCARCGKHLTWDERGTGWSVQHRRPRGTGGTTIAWVAGAANGILLCGSAVTGCHGWAETHRVKATREGFLISLHSRVRATLVRVHHHLWGWIYLLDDGGWERADAPTYGAVR